MLKIIKTKSFYVYLITALLLAGCATSAMYDQAEPASEATLDEGGMGGTGQTDACRDSDNKLKRKCQERPLP